MVKNPKRSTLKKKSFKSLKTLKTLKKKSWKQLLESNCKYINDTHTKGNKGKRILKKIALEEAIMWPTQTEDTNFKLPLEYILHSGDGKDKYNRLLDITDGHREKEMDENNVIIQVISPTAPGIEEIKDTTIEGQVKKAKEVNDYMYNKIKLKPNKFKAFCSLPMRDPKQASVELERCVKELGMLGALVNGNEVRYTGKTPHYFYYDTPDYDILWNKFEELDVPLYLHPSVYESVDRNSDKELLNMYEKYPMLEGSVWGFHFYLAQQIIRIILSGVFDRFPKFKLIIGHMGEILPWFQERFDHRLCVYKSDFKAVSKNEFEKNNLPTFKIPKLTLDEYLRKNIYVTTSGWFSNDALEFTIKKIGIDRVMFSIDYPFEKQSIACDWMDNVPLSFKDKEKIAYKNAARILKIKL
jgi:predicted TIM-barrel fold metal-dependent hydrolase